MNVPSVPTFCAPFEHREGWGTLSRGDARRSKRKGGPARLFEIQGPGTDKRMRRATTDENGRFKIGHVSVGRYKFKATLNGYQSSAGTIIVSKKADKERAIRIEMLIGN